MSALNRENLENTYTQLIISYILTAASTLYDFQCSFSLVTIATCQLMHLGTLTQHECLTFFVN